MKTLHAATLTLALSLSTLSAVKGLLTFDQRRMSEKPDGKRRQGRQVQETDEESLKKPLTVPVLDHHSILRTLFSGVCSQESVTRSSL
jgi:hypothetical protein